MKKKLISLALAFILALSLLPSPAIAADGDFTIEDGVLVTYYGSGGNVTIPSGVTSIGNSAFRGRSYLTNVTIPSGVTSIGERAFEDCSSLTSITIPDSVTSIGELAFEGCSSLTSITIPDSVTGIRPWTFKDCSSLTSITIPSSVTYIYESAFENCSSLTSVTIPDSVTSIASTAFENCSSLTSIAIPSSATYIGAMAFDGCSSLTDVYYSGSEAQWKAISINGTKNTALTSAAIHYNSTGPSGPSIPAAPTTPSADYIYDIPNSGADVILDTDRLNMVTDPASAASAVQPQVQSMTSEQKASATGVDLATLYAETAAAKAASQKMDNGDLLINAALLADLQSASTQAISAVEGALTGGGVTTARYLSNTVTLVTDEANITVRIDPDVLTTEVDKVRVETPNYALTFKLPDLAPDLTQTLTFSAKSAAAGSTAPSTAVSSFSSNADGQNFTTIFRSIVSNAAAPAVEIGMTGGKTTNSITVSLPSEGGDTTYRTVATSDGTATASKYNPATTMMDGKVNISGTYTLKSNEKDFTDIANKSTEMQKAIRYLASKGIINGTTATTFSPDGSINRAEIATLLVKALGKLDSTATASFSDVTKGNWFYTAAASSQRHKLINGYEDNTFRGTTNISKVQIVAVSSRVLKTEMGYKEPALPATYLSKYSDTIASWAQSEVALATKENLVVYRTDGTFSGSKNMTRGDAAIIIYRLFQRIW